MRATTKSRKSKTRADRSSPEWRSALSLVTVRGRQPTTIYKTGVIDEARDSGVMVRVIEDGNEVLREPRKLHRSDLFEPFRDRPDEGKYVQRKAIQGDRISGAIHVGRKLVPSINPYLRTAGSFHTIMLALQQPILNDLANLQAVRRISRINGVNLDWQGRRNKHTDALVVGPWITEQQLWEQCLKINPDLPKILRKQKSQVKGVKDHKSPWEKFLDNLGVMCRTREVFHVATGEREYTGGRTPYGFPIMQCGMAIDRQFFTDSVNPEAQSLTDIESGQYYVRLAVGRTVPHILTRSEWRGLQAGTKIGYLNDSLRNEAMHIAQKLES